jgi:clan AA aspartic protease (TIGR02281 family)
MRRKPSDKNWKDSYYSPKSFRGRTVIGSDQPQPRKSGSFAKNLLAWGLIFALAVMIFNYFGPKGFLQAPQSSSRATTTHLQQQVRDSLLSNCSQLPDNGATLVFDPSAIKRTDVLFSGLEFQNKHSFPLVAIITNPNNGQKLLAVSVATGSSAIVSLPTGRYGLMLLFGNAHEWCNTDNGFANGARINVEGGINIEQGKTTFAEFEASGQKPGDILIRYQSTKPASDEMLRVRETPSTLATEIIGQGTVELRQDPRGHYRSSGMINGTPVVFMIDTGASTVAISPAVAVRAGISRCTPGQSSTANGIASTCRALVPELQFGAFRMTNVEVSVMPNMGDEALLGMNVLRNFSLEQKDGTLKIGLNQ